MDTYTVQITEPAEDDLTQIGQYISQELLQPEIARNVINRLSDAIRSLQKLPGRNALLTDARLSQMGLRKILVDNYIAFYTINEEDKTVTIIRLLYARREWQTLL